MLKPVLLLERLNVSRLVPARFWPARFWPARFWPARFWPARFWPARVWPARFWRARFWPASASDLLPIVSAPIEPLGCAGDPHPAATTRALAPSHQLRRGDENRTARCPNPCTAIVSFGGRADSESPLALRPPVARGLPLSRAESFERHPRPLLQ